MLFLKERISLTRKKFIVPLQAHDLSATLHQHQCNVMKLHQLWYDIASKSCACWVTDSEIFYQVFAVSVLVYMRVMGDRHSRTMWSALVVHSFTAKKNKKKTSSWRVIKDAAWLLAADWQTDWHYKTAKIDPNQLVDIIGLNFLWLRIFLSCFKMITGTV